MSREAEIVLRANDRELERSLDNSKRKLRSKLGGLGKELGRSLSGAMSTGLNLLGVGGIGAIAVAGRGVFEFQKGLTRLQIAGGKTRGEMLGLEKAMFRVGKSSAVDPDKLLAGASAYTALTGDLGTYTKGMGDLAKVATATGAEMEDLSTVAAAMSGNLGIAGGEFGTAFDILAAQGKAGAVELSDMSQILAGLTPQFATFNHTGIEGLTELGALLQIVRGGFGSSKEAATGLESVMSSLTKNAGKFQKAGVRVFDVGPDGEKRMRNLSDIIYDIGESKLAKDKTALLDALGRTEAYQAVIQLLSKGRGEFDRLANSAGAAGTIQKDFDTYMSSTAGKIESAGVSMKEAFNNALKDNIAGIAEAMNSLASVIDWIGRHPIAAALSFVGAKVAVGALGSALAAAFAGKAAASVVGAGGAAVAGAAAGGGGAAAGAAGGAAAGAGKGAVVAALTSPAALVIGATAAGAALGTFADRMLGLSDKISDLFAFGSVQSDDPQLRTIEGEKKRADKSRASSVEQARLRRTQNELMGLGWQGTVGQAADMEQGPDANKLRAAAAAAKAMGVDPAEFKRLGADELVRQFPLALNADGEYQLDEKKYDAIRAKTPDDQEFQRGERVDIPSGPVTKVEVVVRFDDSGRMIGEIVEQSAHQRRQ